ncbi:MAG: 50S ribosomal protein L9 [Spirochaetia bacterium]
MKIVLRKDIQNLGEEGDIKDVADGYARNFLIPQGFAVFCNRAALNDLEKRRHHIEKRREEKRKEAYSHKEKIEADPLIITVAAGEKGKIFGAVTSAIIVEELAKKGIMVERKKIDLSAHSIKLLGNYPVKIKLYENESATLQLNIVAQETATTEA